jgi:hypothetical protein
MENLKREEEQETAIFEHSVSNTRLESQPNELLAQVRARVEAQAKARSEKGSEQDGKHGFARK